MLKQLGNYKERVLSVLRSSDDIKTLLLSEMTSEHPDADAELMNRTLPYLFSDGCISETKSYIFVDVSVPKAEASTIQCKIKVQAVSHKNNYVYDKAGFSGSKPDILTQMIFKELIENKSISNEFGIGALSLSETETIQTKDYFGHTLTFTFPDFR